MQPKNARSGWTELQSKEHLMFRRDKKVPFHTPPELWRKHKPLARQMRHQPTAAEDKLWQTLRRQSFGVNFRRQHTIDRFIIDFFCPAARLIVEVDGDIHDYTQEEDAIRQEFLETQGFRVIRFPGSLPINCW